MEPTPIRDLCALPKAHLHIHLEGAMRGETLTELCLQYGIERPVDTKYQKFDNFGGFLKMYWAACAAVRSRDDLARLILEVAEDAAQQGVRRIEPAFDADRIAHGVHAIEDEALVEKLAEEQICLDICPTSNLLLRVFPSAAEHPLQRLIDAGVPCTLGSDDPLLFGPDLVHEFMLCREEMGMNDQQLAALARASFAHSGSPEQVKKPVWPLWISGFQACNLQMVTEGS